MRCVKGPVSAHARPRQEVGVHAAVAGRREADRCLSAAVQFFNWQTYYMLAEPLQVPKDYKKILSTAWVPTRPRREPIEPRPKCARKVGR